MKTKKRILDKMLLVLSICFFISIGNSQRLTVSATGGKILKDGNPITLRGVNFGNCYSGRDICLT